jgi:hypothetical protein
MNFLSTHFANDEVTSSFDGAFRLLDLPLEVLFKILIFLDDPDLQSLGKTCRYLKMAANERFISRSKFLYVKQKVGVSLQLRPSSQDLYERNILPTPSKSMLTNFNINHFQLASDLQRSFRRDSLSKRLRQRPSKQDLKGKNIIPREQTSELVKERLKELKKENLSQMLEVLTRSYKFQRHNEIPVDEELEPETTATNSALLNPIEVTDEFTMVYLKFFKRLSNNAIFSKASSNNAQNSAGKSSAYHQLLNHIESSQMISEGTAEGTSPKDSTKPVREVSKVRSAKEFFEKLSKSSSSPLTYDSDNEPKLVTNKMNQARKPSKMILKASVMKDNIINYEKMY